MSDLINQRTYTSYTRSNGGGLYTLEAHSGHQNWIDNGTLEPVDLTFRKVGSLWTLDRASHNIVVPEAPGLGRPIRYSNRFEGVRTDLDFTPIGADWVNLDDPTLMTREPCRTWQPAPGVMNADHNQVSWPNAFGDGIDLSIEVLRHRMRKNVVIRKLPVERPAFANWALAFIFDWDSGSATVKPEGTSPWNERDLISHTGKIFVEEGPTLKTGIDPAYMIDSAERRRQKRIPVPIAFRELSGRKQVLKILSAKALEGVELPVSLDQTPYYTTVGDGEVKYLGDSDWDTTHDAPSGTSHDYTSTDAMTGGERFGTFALHRTFWVPNTAALPDAATLTGGTFYGYCTYVATNDGASGDSVLVGPTTQNDEVSLEDADYDQCDGTDSFDILTDSVFDVSAMSTSTWYNVALNATGLAMINKTGNTLIGLRCGYDIYDSAPLDNFYSGFKFATSESANDAYLNVVYRVPVGLYYYHHLMGA